MGWREEKESVPYKSPIWSEQVQTGAFAAHLAGPPKLIWWATQVNIVLPWEKDHAAEQLSRLISCKR